MKQQNLETLRQNMKDKDKEIIRLLNERSRISVKIGEVKGKEGIEVYDPAQEAKVHGYLHELNSGPLPQTAITAIFREIISASRELQKPMAIAFFGAEASFTHLAARSHFGDSSRYFPQPRIDRVFDEVEKGSVNWGVVPIENSLEGSVNITLDRLILTPLKIRAEIFMREHYPFWLSGGARCIDKRSGIFRKNFGPHDTFERGRFDLRHAQEALFLDIKIQYDNLV